MRDGEPILGRSIPSSRMLVDLEIQLIATIARLKNEGSTFSVDNSTWCAVFSSSIFVKSANFGHLMSSRSKQPDMNDSSTKLAALHEDMSVKDICLEIGRRIRAERIRRELSQLEMASLANLTLRTYRRLEADGVGTIRVLVAALRAYDRIKHLAMLLPQSDLAPTRTALAISLKPRVRRRRTTNP